MIRRPPRSTLFPTRRSSDLEDAAPITPESDALVTACRDGSFWAAGRHADRMPVRDRKSTRLNSSHGYISYAVFCLKKKKELHSTRARCASMSYLLPL